MTRKEKIIKTMQEINQVGMRYISGRALASMLGCTWREIAHDIEALRNSGIFIDAGNDGYHLCENSDEIRDCLARYRARMYTMLSNYNRVKRLARRSMEIDVSERYKVDEMTGQMILAI